MNCDQYLQLSQEYDWDEAGRRRVADMLHHLETCPSCRDAIGDYDSLRATLGVFRTDVEPPQEFDSLVDRFSRLPAIPANFEMRPRSRWFMPLAAAALVVVSATIATAVAYLLVHHSQAGTSYVVVPPATQPAPATFEPREMTHEVSAFNQVSKVFDGRASWMLVSDQASAVGVATGNDALARRVLLLRLILTRGADVVSDADLLVIPGQSADLTVPLPKGQSLHYRIGTSTDEPTRLTLWLELKTPHGKEPLAAMATNLQLQPGQRVTAGQLSTSAGDYQLKLGFARSDIAEGKP